MSNFLQIKRIKMTAGILCAYLTMMIFVACVDQPDLYPFGQCAGPVSANATDISIIYAPYVNNKYVTESDTVKFADFNLYMKITPEVISDVSWISSFPGAAYALSCAQSFNFKNITSIKVSLLAPYGDLKAGTDISNLITINDVMKLSEFKNFDNSLAQYKLTINTQPSNKTQLKTKTILSLKNGTEKVLESTSPVLLTN
ncbi:hypothetical protein [Algoriphagus aquimarinus]|uniref:Uncharacterized protein n=1 Tax=Algoriphagus aquimarinus TaxID=237018 RepID=A0A1I1C8V6_9BACT|nr:hypothetical protein [Algoriphagus aquimarinus]SFB58456.1 hypothetical protein SAMN04489723_1247 [Algoriphagus aquimarinus]